MDVLHRELLKLAQEHPEFDLLGDGVAKTAVSDIRGAIVQALQNEFKIGRGMRETLDSASDLKKAQDLWTEAAQLCTEISRMMTPGVKFAPTRGRVDELARVLTQAVAYTGEGIGASGVLGSADPSVWITIFDNLRPKQKIQVAFRSSMGMSAIFDGKLQQWEVGRRSKGRGYERVQLQMPGQPAARDPRLNGIFLWKKMRPNGQVVLSASHGDMAIQLVEIRT